MKPNPPDELDKILYQLQVGTLYADNTEPGMTYHRDEAKVVLTKLLEDARIDELSSLASQYKHPINGHCAKNKFNSIVQYKPCVVCVLEDRLVTLKSKRSNS